MNISYSFRTAWASLLMMALVSQVWAEAPVGVQPRKVQRNLRTTTSDCLPPSASSQLDINNIRTLLHNGGDMWWDLVGDPRYEVPKGSGRHSLFAGSLWIGGLDEAGQLRVAAQTYRQSGNDFWPGPLNDGEALIDEETCEFYDNMFKINRTEIDEFRAEWATSGPNTDMSQFPNVQNWPTGVGGLGYADFEGNEVSATLPSGEILYLAPFIDVNDNQIYDPLAGGDYPDIRGDQAIWWIVNDKGNVHTETGGEPIGVEIHMLAFAFTTANAVNNMTFYDQLVINRSNLTLTETYIGQWVDPDMGNFRDDYVGCDTLLGLGYCYNGDADDEGAAGYGSNPPAVGVDFFQGPLADPDDGVDNDKDGIVDEQGETIIMSKFVYYNNDFSLVGNPEIATHYYGYLRGFWKDGTPIVDNGTNGYGPSAAGDPTNYMFYGDACNSTGWTENAAGNPPADRRFIQSAGPFTLQPGAVNEIITGVVWARSFSNDQIGSVCEMIRADRIAQALFDSGFQLLDGPDAPVLDAAEFDQRLVLSWGYPSEAGTNNFNEKYVQADPVLKAENVADSTFAFEGYVVYQLVDQTVAPNELNDPERARIVAQCDVENGVSTITNRSETVLEGLDDPVIVDEIMVQGSDNGIFTSIEVTDDLFASGADSRLKNYTTYYYSVIAYAYNDTSSDGRAFVQGNRNYRVTAALPHPVEQENGGTVLGATYGDGIPVTMTAGVGNGGNFVELTEETETEIINNGSVSGITYKPGAGPIEVKVVDPKKVRGAYYQVRVNGRLFIEREEVFSDTTINGTRYTVIDSTFSEWDLYESSSPGGPFTGDPVFRATFTERSGQLDNNDNPLSVIPRPAPLSGTERVVPDRGFSVSVQDVPLAGDTLLENMGIVGATLTFDDPSQAWLTGLPDNDDFAGGVWDWIVSDVDRAKFRSAAIYDPESRFEELINGGVGPFCLARSFVNDNQAGGEIGPGLPIASTGSSRQMAVEDYLSLEELTDVDIVFTSNEANWTRCLVVETSPFSGLGTGAWQLSGKWIQNVNKDGSFSGDSDNPDPTFHGFSWFPGYAIDVNTGTRLHVFFGESHWDVENRGNDMRLNPTVLGSINQAGGRHYVYVTNLPYSENEEDLKAAYDQLLNADNLPVGAGSFSDAIGGFPGGKNMARFYRNVAWVAIPLLNAAFDDITDQTQFPTDARASLRVNQPFRSREGTTDIPTFEFNTEALEVQTQQTAVAEEALDDVLVVPNPYYAFSAYESSQLQNTVKITNLPERCQITIFNLNGQVVRSYRKDSSDPDQDWDMRNQSGIPVGSGVYIIHVDAGDLGETVVKLFAVMRQVDLDSF
ncbi:MAG: T9SS type A sorting domain-containing protein [Bacteroidota bacterium]